MISKSKILTVFSTFVIAIPLMLTSTHAKTSDIEYPKKKYENHHIIELEVDSSMIQSIQQQHLTLITNAGGLTEAVGIQRDKENMIKGLIITTMPEDQVQSFLESVVSDGTVKSQFTEYDNFDEESETLRKKLDSEIIFRDAMNEAISNSDITLSERIEAQKNLAIATTNVAHTRQEITETQLRKDLSAVTVHYLSKPQSKTIIKEGFTLQGPNGPLWAFVTIFGAFATIISLLVLISIIRYKPKKRYHTQKLETEKDAYSKATNEENDTEIKKD